MRARHPCNTEALFWLFQPCATTTRITKNEIRTMKNIVVKTSGVNKGFGQGESRTEVLKEVNFEAAWPGRSNDPRESVVFSPAMPSDGGAFFSLPPRGAIQKKKLLLSSLLRPPSAVAVGTGRELALGAPLLRRTGREEREKRPSARGGEGVGGSAKCGRGGL